MSKQFTRQDLINAGSFHATFTKRDNTTRKGNFEVAPASDQRYGDDSPLVVVKDLDQGGAFRTIDATKVSELAPPTV